MLHVLQFQKQGNQNKCAYSISQVREIRDRINDLLQTPKEESDKNPIP